MSFLLVKLRFSIVNIAILNIYMCFFEFWGSLVGVLLPISWILLRTSKKIRAKRNQKYVKKQKIEYFAVGPPGYGPLRGYGKCSENFWIFQILFFTPFFNQKRYFCVFWPFYAQILTKKPKMQKVTNTLNFSQKNKMFQYTTWSRKIFSNSQILFLTSFCNQKLYFDPFF